MIVAELRIIVDHVPGDLDVIVCSHGACHVDLVERSRAGRNGGPDNVWVRLHGPGVGRSMLVLRGGSDLLRLGGTPWWGPAPDFTLRAKYQRDGDPPTRSPPPWRSPPATSPTTSPNVDRVKLAGNAVTPPVTAWITGRLLRALEAAA
ncbi:MAG: hypothetical protein ACRDZN_16425 [Acidimicrobiales bacterium]